MILALTRDGGLAVSGGGVLIILAGAAMLFDWLRLGTAFASYYAILNLTLGKRKFVREWQRRAFTRRVFGGMTLLIGSVWFVGGLVAALSH